MASSVNPYGKVNEAEQERLVARRNTRKRLTIIGVSSIVLVAVVVAAVVGVTQSKNGNKSRDTNSNDVPSAIRASCSVTLYPDSCYQSLAPYVKSGKIKPKDIFKLSVQVAIDELSNAYRDFEDGGGLKKLIDNNNIDNMTLAALESCQELVSLALDHLNSSLSFNTNESDKSLLEVFGDFRTWLSSAGTYQQTCIDSFDNATSGMISTFVQQRLKNSTVFTSNSLAMVTELESSMESINGLGEIGKRRRLMMNSDDEEEGPKWLSSMDRKLLQSKTSQIKADAVVAKDGSGKYKTIKAALKNVPEKSKKRFVIYVKKGVYFENVRIEKKMWNVMMIGDGKDATIVSGSLNFVDGTPTFQTATFCKFSLILTIFFFSHYKTTLSTLSLFLPKQNSNAKPCKKLSLHLSMESLYIYLNLS